MCILGGYIRFPKKILLNEDYRNMSDSAKVMFLYLMSMCNSFKREEFFREHSLFVMDLRMSKTSIWRRLKELEKIGVSSSSSKKYYQFSLKNFYEKWAEV